MQIPRVNSFLDLKSSEEYIKIISLDSFIYNKIDSDDSRVNELQDYEKTIYCGWRFSAQINVDGFDNFFDYGVAVLYADIVAALKVIGAFPMAELLERSKQIIFVEREFVPGEINQLEAARFEQVAEIEDQAAEDEFHEKLKAFTLACFEQHGFTLAD